MPDPTVPSRKNSLMVIRSQSVASIPWGHVALIASIAAVVGWYLKDTYDASAQFGNLIFILPVSLFAFLLCAIILAQILREAFYTSGPSDDARTEPVPARRLGRYATGLLIALFALFVVGSDRIGFDVSGFFFIALALLLQGERRFALLIVYPAVFIALLTYGFKAVVPVPLPTLLF